MSQRTLCNFPDKLLAEESARKGREIGKSPSNKTEHQNLSASMFTTENKSPPKNENDEHSKEGYKQGKMGARRSSWYMRGYKRRTDKSFANCPRRTCTVVGGQPLAPTSSVDEKLTVSAPTGTNIVPIPASSSDEVIAEISVRRSLKDFLQRPPEQSWRNVEASFPPLRDVSESLQNTATQDDSLTSRIDTQNKILFRKDASESENVPSDERSGITLFAGGPAGGPTIPRPPERWIGNQPAQRGTRNPSNKEAGKTIGNPTVLTPSSAIVQIEMPSEPLLRPIDEDRVGNNSLPPRNGGDVFNSQSDSNEMIGSKVLAASGQDSSEEEGLCYAMERCLLKMDICKIIDRMSYADFEDMRNCIDIIACFFVTVCSPEDQRNIVMETFCKSLEDPQFAAKAGAFYSVIQSITIEDIPVKNVLIEALIKTVSEWDTGSVDREKSLNAVFLLSEFYYEMTYEDEYINVCGETLINCLKTLVTEDDRDVETLTTCLVINGTRLMQEHSNSFQELMDVVRLSLRNSLTSRRYRNHVLFIIDMHHAQFRYLSEDREKFYKRLLGEHTFFGFRRLVPSLAPFLMQGSNSGDTTEDLQFESGLSDSEGPEEHPQLPDLLSPPENGVVCYQNSLAENPATGIVPNSLSGYGGQVCSCNPVYYTPIMESCVGQDQQLTYGSSYTAIPHSDTMEVFMDNDQRGQLYDSYPNNIPGNHLYPSIEGFPVGYEWFCCPLLYYGGVSGHQMPQQGHPICNENGKYS